MNIDVLCLATGDRQIQIHTKACSVLLCLGLWGITTVSLSVQYWPDLRVTGATEYWPTLKCVSLCFISTTTTESHQYYVWCLMWSFCSMKVFRDWYRQKCAIKLVVRMGSISIKYPLWSIESWFYWYFIYETQHHHYQLQHSGLLRTLWTK